VRQIQAADQLVAHLDQRPRRLLGPFARADVDDRRQDDDLPGIGPDRVEADLYRNLVPVMVSGKEIAAGPHGPHPGVGEEGRPMLRMPPADPFRH
jgi:hypothetical protein